MTDIKKYAAETDYLNDESLKKFIAKGYGAGKYEDVPEDVKERLYNVRSIFVSATPTEDVIKQSIIQGTTGSYTDDLGLRYDYNKEQTSKEATINPNDYLTKRLKKYKRILDELDTDYRKKFFELKKEIPGLPNNQAEDMARNATRRIAKNKLDILEEIYPRNLSEQAYSKQLAKSLTSLQRKYTKDDKTDDAKKKMSEAEKGGLETSTVIEE